MNSGASRKGLGPGRDSRAGQARETIARRLAKLRPLAGPLARHAIRRNARLTRSRPAFRRAGGSRFDTGPAAQRSRAHPTGRGVNPRALPETPGAVGCAVLSARPSGNHGTDNGPQHVTTRGAVDCPCKHWRTPPKTLCSKAKARLGLCRGGSLQAGPRANPLRRAQKQVGRQRRSQGPALTS